jgi:hypothetical protein
MNKHSIELADVLRSGFTDYISQCSSLPLEHYKIANALMNCHTAALGGHVFKCNQCEHENIAYNSCRNRHCPSCQAAARAEWVDNRVKELLPVPYFHVVFTVPSQLNPFTLRNKKVVYNILFKAASDTLHTLAERKKYLGAGIGFIAVLHTWGQNLLDHPHLHCVVPAGGLSCDHAHWKTTPKETFLFPVRVVSRLFRGKFLAMFKEAMKNGDIKFHGTLQSFEKETSSFGKLLDSLYKTEWVVYSKPPFAGPKAVLKYLGRYTHRIAISNSRIEELDNETVSFKWKDYADDNRQKVMKLSHVEFIRRFLLHVLPTGFVRIRYFGFLGQAVKKEKLQRCMELLGVLPQQQDETSVKHNEPDGIDDTLVENIHKWCCPICNKGQLVPYLELPRPYHRNIERAAVA